MRDLYGRLTSEKRIQFWTITSTMFSTILVFWLGFTIQYFVLEKNTEADIEAEQNVRFQLINHIYPMYQEQHIKTSQILAKCKSTMDGTEGLCQDDRYLALMEAIDIDELCNAAEKSAYIMDKARYYFGGDIHQEISRNNMTLLFGSKVLKMFRRDNLHNINEKSIRDSLYLASRLAAIHVNEDTILKRTLISATSKYANALKTDTISNIEAILKISQFEIGGTVLIKSLEENETIMDAELHKYVKSDHIDSMFEVTKNALHSIWHSLVSGKNLPHLMYSIIMLVLILLIGSLIWIAIIRWTFVKEDGTLLAKPFMEIEKEIESLRHEIFELKNGVEN